MRKKSNHARNRTKSAAPAFPRLPDGHAGFCEQIIRLAELGGITRRAARSIYGQVEEATIGGWRAAAKHAGVSKGITMIWEKEMLRQTRQLRADARRSG